MSFRKTLIAARELRKSARLMWVPVTAHAPLKFIKRCATRRWQENIVIAKEFSELEKPATVNHIIADMCHSSLAGEYRHCQGIFRAREACNSQPHHRGHVPLVVGRRISSLPRNFQSSRSLQQSTTSS